MPAGGLCTGRQHLRSACPSLSATCVSVSTDNGQPIEDVRSYVLIQIHTLLYHCTMFPESPQAIFSSLIKTH